jgi:hypothetical protein
MECMASNQKKTTMAKRNRENALRERRLQKQAKKDARKQAAADRRSGAIDKAPGVDGMGSGA